MSDSLNLNTATEEHEVDPVQLRRATLASSVGSALEYYDFYIYGLASALIFGELYRHNDEWKFKAVGAGFSGGLGPLAASHGVNLG